MSLTSSTQKLTIVLVNPASGNQRGTAAAGQALEYLLRWTRRVLIYETNRGGKARRKIEALEEQPARVIVVGGDGTINEVCAGMVARGWQDVPIGLIPMGTGNILAKELGVPRHPLKAARALLHAGTRALDIAQLGDGRVAFACVGVGFDGTLVHGFHDQRDGPQGKGKYVRHVLKYMTQRDWPAITVSVDGQEISDAAAWVLVCNTRSYGGPLGFAPAVPDDGLLDVVVMQKSVRQRWFSYGWRAVLKRDVTGHPHVRYVRGTDVRIAGTAGDALPVQADGDPLGHTPLRVALRGDRLLFYAPWVTSTNGVHRFEDNGESGGNAS